VEGIKNVYETPYSRWHGTGPGHPPRQGVYFCRAQYVTLSVSVPKSANAATGSVAYIEFEYHLFREKTAQHGAYFWVGCAKGLPWQTLKVIEGAARDFVVDSRVVDQDARTALRISIYEVWNRVSCERKKLMPNSREMYHAMKHPGTKNSLQQILMIIS